MHKKELFLILTLVAVVIAGPIYILSRDKDQPASTPVESVQKTEEAVPPAEEIPPFDKAKYSHDDPISPWVVVNKTRPLSPKDYAPTDLVAVGGGQRMRQEAATALARMIADAKQIGFTINPLSGYRSYSTQVSVYNNEVARYGQAVADTQSARPGTSEHQTGWAIDVGGGGCGVEDCFGDTPVGKWVAANAYKYGFVVRYTDDKQQITGYRAEPWHLRYIGSELSAEMQKQGVLTLEEFFGLPPAPDYTN